MNSGIIRSTLRRSLTNVSRIHANKVGSSIRQFHATRLAAVKVGDSIPSSTLFGASPGDKFDIAAEVGTGKSILVFVPGAFSPGCTASHIPGYLSYAKKFAEKGINKIIVIAGNDAFVMNSWAKSLGDANGKIKYLADPSLKFITALDLNFDASKFFGNERSKRAVLLIDNGKVVKTFIEPDNTSVNVSEAGKVFNEI
ncbi:thioredoxin-like protein [Dipodascopsis uninucleata]